MIVDNDKPVTSGDFAKSPDKWPPRKDFTLEELRTIPKGTSFDILPLKTGYWYWERTVGPVYQARFVEYTGSTSRKECGMTGQDYTAFGTQVYLVYVDGKPLLGWGEI